jgi:site-specific DNA-cytosine methylase
VGENVPGLLTNAGGVVFEQVCTDLESEGYEVQAFIIPACGVNAPHRRDRVWVVAYSNDARRSKGLGSVSGTNEEIPERYENAEFGDTGGGDATHPDSINRRGKLQQSGGNGARPREESTGSSDERTTKDTHQDGRGSNERESQSSERQQRDVGAGNNERVPTYYDEAGTVTNAEHPRQHAPEIGRSMGAGNDGNKAGTNEASQFGGRAVSERVVANATSEGRKEREQVTGRENAAQDGTRLDGEHQRHGREWTTPNTGGTGQQERHTTTITEGQGQRTGVGNNQLPNWDGFPTQSPVCRIYDGFSEWMVKLIKPEIYASISKGYTNEDLQEMCNAISSEEVWQQIRRLYKIHEPGILLEILQLCKTTSNNQKGLSVLSEEVSKKILRKVRIFGTLANTPRGRKLGKQQSEQPNDALQFLPHEIALGAMEIQGAVGSFLRNHRRQSIKAYGNSIVPQVAFQILQAIQKTL